MQNRKGITMSLSKFKKAVILGAAIALAAGVFTGCSSGEKAAASSAAAGNKTAVKTLISSNEPPLNWKDENGKLHGYEYEILEAINTKLKDYTLDIDAVPDETVDVMMESGEAKVAAGGYYSNKQRLEQFILPENPIGASSLMIYVRKGEASKYSNLEDVVNAHLKLAPFSPNGGAFRIMTEWNNAHGNPLPEIPVQSNFSQTERLKGLASGQFDALITPNNLGVLDHAAKLGIEIEAVKEPVKVNKTYLLVNKNETKLAQELNDALGELRKDGTLSKISEKYYKEDLFKLLKD